jgi:cell division protein FtsB
MRFFGSIQKKYVFGLAVFISAMFILTIFDERGLMHIYQLREERARIQAANTRLREENQKLTEQVNRMRNNQSEIEKIARENLGLVKKGEIVYQFE